MSKFCSHCGNELDENVKYCPKCGSEVGGNVSDNQTTNQGESKSKIAAGLFGILLGSFGVHNFYLGYTSKGIAQLLLTLVGWIACGIGPVVAGIWGLIDGILILAGSINQDANGNSLRD